MGGGPGSPHGLYWYQGWGRMAVVGWVLLSVLHLHFCGIALVGRVLAIEGRSLGSPLALGWWRWGHGFSVMFNLSRVALVWKFSIFLACPFLGSLAWESWFFLCFVPIVVSRFLDIYSIQDIGGKKKSSEFIAMLILRSWVSYWFCLLSTFQSCLMFVYIQHRGFLVVLSGKKRKKFTSSLLSFRF